MFNGLNLTAYVANEAYITGASMSRGEVYFQNITNVQAENCQIDNWFVSSDDSNFGPSQSGQGFVMPYDGVHNTDWSENTVFAVQFRLGVDPETGELEPSLNFGNLDTSADVCSKVLVKKRVATDSSSKWVTVHEQSILSQSDFDFSFIDYTNPGNSEIEYSYVPIIKGVERASVSNKIKSEFEGWFLCEPDAAYQIYLDGSNNYTFNQQGATVVALDRKFPFTIHNGKARYFTGTLKGIFYDRTQAPVWLDSMETKPLYEYDPNDYYIDYASGEEKRRPDAKLNQAMDFVYNDEFGYLLRRRVDNFLTDNKVKILKDYEGKIWLIDIVENISIDTSKRQSAPVHTIPWVEVADVNSGGDLYKYGFINTDYDRL